MKKTLLISTVLVGIIGLLVFIFPKLGIITEPPAVNQTITPTQIPTTPTAQPSLGVSMQPTQQTTPQGVEQIHKPDMLIDKTKSYTGVLTTSAGKITITLNAQETPITVNNFVYLARQKFYNNTVFHRVIKGFMIQGGDPKGDGTGGPGYRFNDEPFTGDYSRGTVAMANAGPNTNGSQFFIMHQDSSLPKNYVIFGKVTSGMEVVDAIANAPVTSSSSGENSKPVNPVVVTSIEIEEK